MAINWEMVGAIGGTIVGIPSAVAAVFGFRHWVYRRNRQKERTDSKANVEKPANTQTGLPIHEPAGFFGRTSEMATVVAALLDRKSLLIHGEPGIGKTELAIQSLRSTRIRQAYQGRQHYVDLVGRGEVSLAVLCDEVARLMEARAVLEAQDLSQKISVLIANLGSPPPLLVFNNADGPAAVASVVAFRQRVMDGPILVTSRDPVQGMTLLELGPLNPDAALRLFTRYAGRPPKQEERLAVDDILGILDGNPQAIILTAGVFQDMSAADLLKALRSHPFDVVGPVHAAFDVSYERLTKPQQRLFAAFGVFAGPDFSGEAVQSLFDEDIAIDLARLCGVSLLRRDQESRRYSLHPLLKQYATEKISEQERDTLALRLANFFSEFTGAHDEPTEEHLNAISLDFPNIRGVVEWCLARPRERPAMLVLTELTVDLHHFLRVRGYWTERVAWSEAGAKAAKFLENDHRLATIAGNLAIAYQDKGDMDHAKQGFLDAREAFQRLGDERNVGVALHQLGVLAQDQGQPDEARDLYQQSLEIEKRLGDQQGIARTLHQLGMLAYSQGRLDEARDLYQQSLEIEKRLGDQQGIAISLHQLGMLAQDQGRLDEARDLYQQSLEIEKRLGNQQGIAISLHQLGMLDEDAGRLHEAQRQFAQALAILERLGSPDATTARLSLQRVQEKLKAKAP